VLEAEYGNLNMSAGFLKVFDRVKWFKKGRRNELVWDEVAVCMTNVRLHSVMFTGR
jgi:hypothetical protein